MQNDIDRILIDRQTIAARVKAVAEAIVRDHAAGNGRAPGSEPVPHPTGEITLVPILTGSLIFLADLVREMPVYMQIRMMSISSYPGASTESRGAVVREGLSHLPASLEGRHVLLIDDIFDTGRTLQLAVDLLRQRNPASVRTCVLLFKDRPDNQHLSVDYHCFRIPDEFVVGYGLDFNDYYRNLPEIVTLKKHVIESARTG